LRGHSRTIESDDSVDGEDGAFGFRRDVCVSDSGPENVANGTTGDAYCVLEISRGCESITAHDEKYVCGMFRCRW
jgi:hypothetical protein